MRAAPKRARTSDPTAPLLSDISVRQGSWRCVGRFQTVSQPAQVGIVSLGVVRRFSGDDLLFLTGEFRSQLVGDGFGYLALDRKDVGQFAIKGIGPKMRIVGCFD